METATQIAGYAGMTTSPVPTSPTVMGPLKPKIDFGSILSGGLNLGQTAFTMFGAERDANAALASSQIQARALELSAQETMLSAQQEEIRGKQETNNIMDQMIQTIASQRLSSAANGVDLGFGTPVSTEKSTRQLAELQLGTSRQDTVIRSLARRRQALATRENALNTITAGKDKASASRLDGYGRVFSSVSEKIMREKNRG